MANERMINRISLGLVYVGGPDEFAISNSEKVHILTEVIDGLERLSDNELDANISWSISTRSVNLAGFTPWQGANWPGLPESYYDNCFDTALWSEPNNMIYFFKGSEYVRIDPANGWQMDSGYPKPIADNWPGFPAGFTSNLDAALWGDPNGKIYFFKGDQYIRVDPSNGWQTDTGYPQPIAGNWPNLDADFAIDIDAALWAEANNKIYFFKGGEYVRIDPANGWQMDAGYPKPIAGNWPDLPDDFTSDLNAALWGDPNGKIYFFKRKWWPDSLYVRIDPANDWRMDPGYPKAIGLSLGEAEALWQDPALTQMGFLTGGDGIQQLTDTVKGETGGQYGYVAFFTKLPTGHFAYAGGLRVIMRKRVIPTSSSFEDWNSINSIFAHETGHIFGAPDEYSASNCNCGGQHGRFFKTPNGNCALCAAVPVDCIMKNSTLNSVCEFTQAAIGWTAFLNNIDGGLYSFTNNALYMFSKGYYVRYTDFSTWDIDAGYPKPIEGNWPGFPAGFAAGIDATLWSDTNRKIYFFKGNQYIRVDPASGWNVDPGYPKQIAGNWPGFPADFAAGIDAAFWSDTNRKMYFFKEDQYIRVEPTGSWNVDPGYPKPIAGNWPGFPADFATGVDAALWSENNSKVYFFKGTRYIRVDPASGWNVDSGYPRFININWMPFPTTEPLLFGQGFSVLRSISSPRP